MQWLSAAFAAGQLSPNEFDERCTTAWSAQQRHHLNALVADLGAPPAGITWQSAWAASQSHHAAPLPSQRTSPTPQHHIAEDSTPRPEHSRLVGLLGGVERSGVWTVPRNLTLVAVFGGVELDFRECTFPPGVTTITAYTCFGGVEMKLPEHVRVINDAAGILGEVSSKHQAKDLPPDAPVVKVKGIGVLGEVEIR